MTAQRHCPRCGTLLPPGDQGGESCRRCLLALGLSVGSAPDIGGPSPGGGALAPERVGPYRVLDVLGTGSVGVVYLAEEPEPPGRRVAVKVVADDKGADRVLARFEEERQALEALTHPGLARVLGAGRTTDGSPWFAVEWARGVPITEHCDRQCLGVPRRLELFVEVCDALQHAHDAGLVHGDIKPSSVLVVEHEGRAGVKVTGLGVVRALDQRPTEEALWTAQGLLTATAAYGSPEQLDPAGAVDGRSDVYSLGALLYELLAGAPPFDLRTLRKARWADLVRLIREEPPLAPSHRVAARGETEAAEVALRRGTEARQVLKQLRGDLDAICLEALEKEPDRRYPAPRDLAMDVERHLGGEPVAARPRGVWSRFARLFGERPAGRRASRTRGAGRP